MYQIIALTLVFVAAVNAQKKYEEHKQVEYYESVPIKYKFKYEVNDPHTHDVHGQEEEGDGKYVKGFYHLKEPHGGERSVHYHDDGHGFVAQVNTAHITHPKQQYYQHEESKYNEYKHEEVKSKYEAPKKQEEPKRKEEPKHEYKHKREYIDEEEHSNYNY